MSFYNDYFFINGFKGVEKQIAKDLIASKPTYVPHWQAMDVSDTALAVTYELLNAVIEYRIPADIRDLQEQVSPNLPWAEDHFAERVSGTPWNPPPSAAYWPFAVKGHADHVDEQEQFSHTYPERMWPKMAGTFVDYNEEGEVRNVPAYGIRYQYGDLVDLLNLLRREPFTRQAYLPIWFPEDLDAAANHHQRVPCTLGYHFLLRNDRLHIFYPIRSCDFVRHFRDDIYLAARLNQWVIEQLDWAPIRPGVLTMHAVSLHCFEGDIAKLRKETYAAPKRDEA